MTCLQRNISNKSSKVISFFFLFSFSFLGADSADFLDEAVLIYFSLVNSLKLIVGFGLTAPNLTGFWLKLFVKILEAPLLGPLFIYFMKKDNKMIEVCCVAFFFLFLFFFFFIFRCLL